MCGAPLLATYSKGLSMKFTIRTILLWITAVIAMAFTASSASATNAVTVTNETEGTTCGTTIPTCSILVEGESTMSVESTMTPVSFCEDTLEATINTNGTGAVTTLTNANHPSGGNCITEKCDGEIELPEEAQWPFSIERDGINLYALNFVFCFDVKPTEPSALGAHCGQLMATVTEEPGDEHDYNVRVNNQHCSTINRIFDATWEVHDDLIHPGNQPHEAIEIQ
jgi:hypothetical protein